MVTLLSRTTGKDEQLDVFHYQPLPNFKTPPCPSVVEEEGEDGTLWRRFDEVGGREQKREKLVCVTSGTSYLGSAIVDRLLSRGYSVRIAVSNQGTYELFFFAHSPFSWRRRRLVGVVEGGIVLCFHNSGVGCVYADEGRPSAVVGDGGRHGRHRELVRRLSGMPWRLPHLFLHRPGRPLWLLCKLQKKSSLLPFFYRRFKLFCFGQKWHGRSRWRSGSGLRQRQWWRPAP